MFNLKLLLLPTQFNIKTSIVSLIKYQSFHLSSRLDDLMEFFDNPDNWGKATVQTGRPWKKDELRIKSNSDLHKLWFVLYKERNMLYTMQEAAKDANEPMPSPERIEKVEESMKNLEDVVRERNKAYWELEIGEGQHGERKKVFRRDIFGRYRWIGCTEHLVPYYLNKKWREFNAPGHGPQVTDFNRRLREKRIGQKYFTKKSQEHYCRQLLVRFPDLDIDYLQEKYPDVDVKFIKDNLIEQIRLTRWNPSMRRRRIKEGR